jgi:hypothetical protein
MYADKAPFEHQANIEFEAGRKIGREDDSDNTLTTFSVD